VGGFYDHLRSELVKNGASPALIQKLDDARNNFHGQTVSDFIDFVEQGLAATQDRDTFFRSLLLMAENPAMQELFLNPTNTFARDLFLSSDLASTLAVGLAMFTAGSTYINEQGELRLRFYKRDREGNIITDKNGEPVLDKDGDIAVDEYYKNVNDISSLEFKKLLGIPEDVSDLEILVSPNYVFQNSILSFYAQHRATWEKDNGADLVLSIQRASQINPEVMRYFHLAFGRDLNYADPNGGGLDFGFLLSAAAKNVKNGTDVKEIFFEPRYRAEIVFGLHFYGTDTEDNIKDSELHERYIDNLIEMEKARQVQIVIEAYSELLETQNQIVSLEQERGHVFELLGKAKEAKQPTLESRLTQDLGRMDTELAYLRLEKNGTPSFFG
jgi:hypothetical protein